jgi:hypothetical protein
MKNIKREFVEGWVSFGLDGLSDESIEKLARDLFASQAGTVLHLEIAEGIGEKGEPLTLIAAFVDTTLDLLKKEVNFRFPIAGLPPWGKR